MTKTLFPLLLLVITMINAQEVKVSSGKVERFENFKSKYVDARNIDVWLPDGYSNNQKYAVLYMHDGQMLYDAESAWNKQSWEIDEIAGKLIAENKIRNCIVVGIWNNGQKRHQEYFPQKPYSKFSVAQKEFISNDLLKKGKINTVFNPISDNYLQFLVTELKPISDNYLQFLVTELKPFIDQTYSVKTDQANTFIAGSSMGGLISMYAICEYPKVFGGAACLSTHWTGIYQLHDNPIPEVLLTYLKANLPNPKNHKLYFDCGDKTLDSLYPSLQKRADVIIQKKGYTTANWTTQYFPGKDHTEKAWQERLHIPLEFLLRKTTSNNDTK